MSGTYCIISIVIFGFLWASAYSSLKQSQNWLHMSVERLNTGVLKVLREAQPYLSVRI